jgi:integration host factor subunit beta
LTKSDLIIRLAEKFQNLGASQSSDISVLGHKDCEMCVRTILNSMISALSQGSRIEVRGFGTFAVSVRPERMGRNPKTGESVLVPKKKVLHFKCGKDLRNKLNL